MDEREKAAAAAAAAQLQQQSVDPHGSESDRVAHPGIKHPFGMGAGAVAGGATAAAIGGAIGGPVGAILGAAVGAFAGAVGGSAVADVVDPLIEDDHWAQTFHTRPYVPPGSDYEHYRSAYRYGWEARLLYRETKWADVEPQLGRGWQARRGDSPLTWEQAREAAWDAWHRLSHRESAEEASDDAGREPH